MLRGGRARAHGCAAAAVALVGAVMLPAHAAKSAPKIVLGPNLLPNASFETSVFEPAPVPQYATSQPLLPVGWTFEGATGLFDHGQHGAHTGKRAATISIPLSTPRSFCQQKQCVDNPINGPRDSLRETYSETPAWRNQNAVPVTAGKTYELSAWIMWALQTVNTGAVTYVRWVDAGGSPIALSAGPKLMADGRTSTALAWTKITGVVTAPKGAAGAVVLLGDGDDAFISSLTYDDAYFGTYTVIPPKPAKKKRHH
jgi:hypothetical protein